jgi:hypothetical protein
MINTVSGARLFDNTREILQLVRNRLRAAGTWEELIDDTADEEELAMRELPELLAEILRLYDNL